MALLVACQGSQAPGSTGLPTAAPKQVGLSASGLARIDALVNQAIADRIVPGTTVLVAKNGKVVYHKAFGHANLGVPMTTDTIFLMYSSSKIIVGIAVMQLVEQGRLRLDDPVSQYLPEFAHPQVKVKLPPGSPTPYRLEPARSLITVRQLLSMTSGIVGYWDEDFIPAGVDIGAGDPDFDLAENTRRLATVPLLFHPGTEFGYGLSTDVAGRVVEVVSGLSLADYYQRHIFGPLGMRDSFFYPPTDKIGRTSVSWESDGQRLTGKVSPHAHRNRKLYSAGVGVYSTTADYFRLGQMLLNGGEYGGVRILKPESVQEIHTNQVGDLPGVDKFHFFQQGYERYGLGCFLNGKGSFRDPGSVSVLGLGGKNLDLNFDRNLLIVVLQTVLPPKPAWEISEQISRLVYQALE
ncbi:beta-lactamase-like protein [Candidatus Symbiobacter mobilis CR]|uniref:Beta-lactamase-like protein n=1 Tax=Candidatus Symbiobacter mobilis CR TaxID=946483 RepID=U5N9C0_9BURK|nr:beta-lactamase-like protein [Candidatus Symbiobacter mobilis CR]